MEMLNVLLKIAGKNNFVIDDRIGLTYLVRVCWKYGVMGIRGMFKSFGYKNISPWIFWGKRIKVYSKKQLEIRSKTKIHDRVRIDALSMNGIVIGTGCVIGEGTIMECTGSLEEIGKGIDIGDRTTFSNDCYFGAAGGISIGHDVVAGQYIRFHSENHNYNDISRLIKVQGVTRKGIKIGNNCWIGSGAVFLDGAKLADGCVVAANAVVNNNFPENSVIGGVPAKLIKRRGDV